MLHLQVESVVKGEMPPYRSTSNGPAKSRGHPDNDADYDYKLESFIAEFVQRSLSQARQMVDEATQVGCHLPLSWQLPYSFAACFS